MGNLGATELLIIAVVIILLFGSKKLPEMARSLGRSAKILKAETSGTQSDDDGHVSQPAQFTRSATQALVTPPGSPATAEHQHEARRIQQQIDDLQRQLAIAQQTQPQKNEG
ncbi:Sec-independent protein translocase subunit TatA [Lentzea sp. NPDC102401]|uniref:Sec-independent protein translocase subunit TatA n=1 Tax=Lentzea sp. NPDC102401 TaxID=3364128 RepID=UPI0037F6760C